MSTRKAQLWGQSTWWLAGGYSGALVVPSPELGKTKTLVQLTSDANAYGIGSRDYTILVEPAMQFLRTGPNPGSGDASPLTPIPNGTDQRPIYHSLRLDIELGRGGTTFEQTYRLPAAGRRIHVSADTIRVRCHSDASVLTNDLQRAVGWVIRAGIAQGFVANDEVGQEQPITATQGFTEPVPPFATHMRLDGPGAAGALVKWWGKTPDSETVQVAAYTSPSYGGAYRDPQPIPLDAGSITIVPLGEPTTTIWSFPYPQVIWERRV